jgi:DnaJ-class molecular chaperone
MPNGRDQQINVKIPAGIRDGTTLRLSELGDDSVPNAPKGDIHLTVQINPHPIFKRENDDLIMDVRIDAIDAMLGTTQDINTIDGKTLALTIKPGTQPGTILSLPGYGMPAMQDNRFVGRLLVNVGISIPTMLTDVQKNQLKEIFSK